MCVCVCVKPVRTKESFLAIQVASVVMRHLPCHSWYTVGDEHLVVHSNHILKVISPSVSTLVDEFSSKHELVAVTIVHVLDSVLQACGVYIVVVVMANQSSVEIAQVCCFFFCCVFWMHVLLMCVHPA